MVESDFTRIKSNLQKMMEQGAPESDMDAYVASENVTPDQLRAAPAAEQPSVIGDIVQSFGAGLGHGALGVAGTSGDVRELMASGVAKGASMLGLGEMPGKIVSGAMRAFPLTSGPTSQQLQGVVEGVTGPFYKPQTPYGEVFGHIGEFAPALIGPKAGLATRALSGVVAPAAALTAAEHVTDNPYAQVGAAVGASLLAHKAVTPKTAVRALTADDLQIAAEDKYRQVHALGLELKPQSMETLSHHIENVLTQDGKTVRNAKPVYDAIETLRIQPGQSRRYITSQDFDNLRKEMVSSTKSSEGSVRGAAGLAIKELDNYLANLPASHVIKGDAKLASELFKEARGNWAAMKRLEMAGGKIELGELNAATAHSGQNIDNAMRQAIKQMIRPDKYGKTMAEKAGFNAAEIKQMNKIARGGTVGNIARVLGNMAGGGLGIGVPITAGVAAYHLGPEAGALPIAGFGLKKFGNLLTQRKVDRLATMVGARSPEGRLQAAIQARLPQPQSATSQSLLPAWLAARQQGILPLSLEDRLAQ